MRETLKILALAFVSSILFGVFTLQSPAQIDPKTVAGMWLFDDGDGETAKDSSGLDNHGTLFGPEWVDDGKIGAALKFDGADDYIDCGNDPSLDLLDNLTIVVWVNHQAGNDGYIMMKNDSSDGVRQYGFLDYPSTCVGINFYCETAGGRSDLCFAGSGVDDNQWHHIAFIIDYPNVTIFIDGEIHDTRKLPSNMKSVDSSLWIGKRKPNNFPFRGIIDEVGIFNVSLSADDVKRIMNDGLTASLAVSPMSKLAASWAVIKTQH